MQFKRCLRILKENTQATMAIVELLRRIFNVSLISYGIIINWAPRLTDLTAHDFFLLCYLGTRNIMSYCGTQPKKAPLCAIESERHLMAIRSHN